MSSCWTTKENKVQDKPASAKSAEYSNPVLRKRLPDPSAIRTKDGTYYLYATEDTRNVPIWKSNNLVDWSFVGTAFTDQTRPSFLQGGGIWAPEVNYINGQYVMYYSMSTWGGHWTAGIGVAVSKTPGGPFADVGKIFDSKSIGVENSIDQAYFEDKGHKYLIWGSFHGIYMVELSADGLALKPGATKIKLGGNAYEGSYIYKRGKYYYYFGSVGTCCDGPNSTYKLVYGRSTSLSGPYVNKKGEKLLDDHYDVLITSNANFLGNGHNAQIVKDDAGQDWMLYHGYEREGQGKWDRFLMLSQVKWDKEGWPFVETNGPEVKASAPTIKIKR